MMNDIQTVLFDEKSITQRVKELGQEVSRDYVGKNPILMGVLKGCFVFMADLARAITVPCQVDFMAVTSYGAGTTSSGSVKILKDMAEDIRGRHVLIVEDILDTGVTLFHLRKMLRQREPASVRICTFFDKPSRRTADITADYVGFTCPDEFIVGYGLDYAEQYRNLPFVGILKPSVYEARS